MINEADIVWVCDVLGFPANAFTGSNGMDSRQSIIRSARSLDVEACPGSGKTTLLVAKLAILGRKWDGETERSLRALAYKRRASGN